MTPTPLGFWIGFNLFVFLMLALDLGVFHRKAHEIPLREALGWSAIWVSLALVFNALVWWWRGHDVALEFLTGYLLEETLSVDNLFVFLLLFRHFRIPAIMQHRVLFWGILGALVMRATFIAAGITLINRFQWLIYVLGAFLVYTGIKMAFGKHNDNPDPSKSLVFRLANKCWRITPDLKGQRFFWRDAAGLFWCTPLFLVLVLLETTDVVFALDSIPAILAVTRDPFIVYTSNIFAILGLRAIYFALSGVMQMFHHLHYALALILAFVGVKMLLSGYIHIPVQLSLALIAVSLTTAIITSIKNPLPAEKNSGNRKAGS
ncbi:MAG: TerC family protein [Opitutaceae bacterium]|jgi:tellurite resistance protein TerC|nr:TerC family protein [Opitutaceae bacterium]